MLTWKGDFTIPRLRAKLANKYLLHPDVEPDYAEVYRPDLSQTSIMRKDLASTCSFTQLRPDHGPVDTLARTAGSWLGQTRRPSFSALDATNGRRTPIGSRPSLDGARFSASGFQDRTLHKTSSVPTLGTRSMDRPPATMQLLEAPPSAPVSPSADEKKANEKEQQALMASRRLWTYAGGSELLIKTQLAIFRTEEPKASNQALLQRLSKAPISGMQIAMKAGARVDWRNQEWDGATLLLKAVRTDSLPLAMYCLSLGADPAAVDNTGRGIFHLGAIEGSPETMGYLIDNYAELVPVSSPDEGGDTPLHLAAYHGHLPVVRLLVRVGADPYIVNAGGFTPGDLAEVRRVWHVASYLSETRQHKEDRDSKETAQIKDLLRPCNLARAAEVRSLAEPKAKAKPADPKKK